MAGVRTVDVKGLDHSVKERLIFPGIEELAMGDAVRLVVDFNPLPLVKMMNARDDIDVAYEKEGPEEWIVLFRRVSEPVDPAGELKTVLKQMQTGAPASAAKARAKRLFLQVDAKAIAALEQELVKEGVSRKTIRENLCAVHLEALRGTLVSNARETPKLHPVRTLMEEHRFILASLRELSSFVERLQDRRSFAEMGDDTRKLKDIALHLVDAESHHQREEEALFPRMEAHGVTEPPGMMREDHEEFRARKRRLFQLALTAETGDFASFKTETLALGRYLSVELADHIFKEDTIVYQLALEVLTPEEWDDVKRGCDAIGYCCFKPEDQIGAAGLAQPESGSSEPAQATVSTGRHPTVELDLRSISSLKKLETILKTWKDLAHGQAMRITNDREPKPLLILFNTRWKGKFDWRYEREGPTDWVATITRLEERA